MLETSIIPIEYDEKTKQMAEELKEIIERNPMLFQIFLTSYKKISFLNSDVEDTMYINSIDDFKILLSHVIPTYMDMLKQQVYSQGGKDIEVSFLRMMLLDIIASKENSDISKEYESEISNNINTIYSLMALEYYEREQDMVNFIFYPMGQKKEKIFRWLNQKHRYSLMNMLLEEEYQSILELESLENDSYLRTHLEELLELSELDILERFRYSEETLVQLPKISQKELDKLCMEFFIQIDPSLKWLKIYNKLKRNNNILYRQKFPDPCSKWGCLETTDNVYIYAPLEYNISDFVYFIHEFVHCVTLLHKEKEDNIPSALQEFPPIFFERCATAFLRKKGYSEPDIINLENRRVMSIIDNRADISPSLRYLIDYLKSGEITFEHEKEKMDAIRNSIPDDLPSEMSDMLNSLMSTKDENNVHSKVDAENAFLIEHPRCILEEYPYVLGSVLADKTLEKVEEDPMIIYTVLSITESLTKETFSSALIKLGLGESQTTNDRKQYQK